MNNDNIAKETEEMMKVVNDDWPMLQELGQKRFIVNKKPNNKNRSVEKSLDILKGVLNEDKMLSEINNIETEKLVLNKDELKIQHPDSESFKNKNAQTNFTYLESKEVEGNLVVEYNKETVLLKNENLNSEVRSNTVKNENMAQQLDFFKLIFSGFKHLYITKTSKLLKPMRFVMDNYKLISIAIMHLIVPLIMTYIVTTQINFVSEQLAQESTLMKTIYISVFFFAAAFLWITSQVFLSGIYTMIRKSMLEIANVGKENK